MGTWNMTLYGNDTTADIKGDYIEALKRGKSNQEAITLVLNKNKDVFGDPEEEPLLWFALSDTLWDYGRLTEEIKQKALSFLNNNYEMICMEGASVQDVNSWKETLSNLKIKLNSKQPKEKKVNKYRLYKCEWHLGDVFAYQFKSDYSKEKGFYNKYLFFRKVSQAERHPGHIVPVIQLYKYVGNELLSINDLEKIDLLEIGFFSTALKFYPNSKKIYNATFINTSRKVIPKNNLIFVGNLPGSDLTEFTKDGVAISYPALAWENTKYNNTIEKYFIEMYLSWSGNDGRG